MDQQAVAVIAAQILNLAAEMIEFRLANLTLDDPDFLDSPYGRGLADGMALCAQGLRVPVA